jgi:hypothetical protein
MISARSPQQRAAVKIVHDALDLVEATMRANAKMRDELFVHHTDLVRVQRQLRELDEEFTPVRPPSRSDVAAAFDTAQRGPKR